MLCRVALVRTDTTSSVSVEATGVCIPTGNSEILLAADYKSPGRNWRDADITTLLSFRNKRILADDLKAEHPFYNTAVWNPSGQKLLQLSHVNDLEISTPQCSTLYSPAGNGDVLNIVIHKNTRL
jgi:hypothetical protein